MKSIVELDIHAPRDKVVGLFNDPNNNQKWMDDLARIEPIKGPLGEPGSVFRFVPKANSSLDFVATMISRNAERTRLLLDNPKLAVAITDDFREISEGQTHLVSEEIFEFKTLVGKITGLFAMSAMRHAHRRHMEAFKHFVEGHA